MRRCSLQRIIPRIFSTQSEGSFFMSSSGFSFPELLISTVIFLLACVGILFTFTRYMELNEMTQNSSLALEGAIERMEAVKNTVFNQVTPLYDDQTFTVAGLAGLGTIDIVEPTTDIREVWVTYSWQQNNGRIVGEDLDLDGVLDGGEDSNGNGRLDSPVQLVTYIFNE